VSHKDLDHIASVLGRELESCNNWLIDNKLSLHPGKTECILFASKRKLNKAKNFKITYNNQDILASKSVKYLGIDLDQSLSGLKIVQNIIKKTNSRLKFLYRQANFLNLKSRKILCSALILCHFDYSCSSWYSGITQTLKNKLQVAQNKTVRFILEMEPRSHIGQAELDSLHMLNVNSRVKQLRLNHVFKIFSNSSPDYLSHKFIKISSVNNHQTRGSIHNFQIPRVNGAAACTFYANAIKDWNSLPSHKQNITKLCTFKISIKDFLSTKSKDVENCMFVYY